MKTSWSVCYRTGGTERCTWHRTLDTYITEQDARNVAGEIETMGYKANVYVSAQLDAIGIPEGWDSESPLRGEMAQYLDGK